MNQEMAVAVDLAMQNLEDLADVTTDLQEIMNQETAADAAILNPEDLHVLVMVL